MKPYSLFRSASSPYLLSILTLSFTLIGCSGSSDAVSDLPYHVTPASALDPEPPEDFITELLATSATRLPKAFEKRHKTANFEDSITNLLSIAGGMLSDDPATHIPYVWGGKHIDRATKWATPPESNANGCTDRIGLDCSGFVQHVFEKAGFGREAPELNANSLAQLDNWNILTDRGYFVYLLPKPAISELIPGDVLFFADGGSIYHTGIYWSASATINGVTGPAMINSLGRSRCEVNIANEAAGNPTGVMISVMNENTQTKLFAAMRMVGSSYLFFGAGGQQFAANTPDGAVASYAIYDTVAKILRVVGYESSEGLAMPAGVVFEARNVTGLGSFEIPELGWYDGHTSLMEFRSEDAPVVDSLVFYATSPPDWWHGATPQPTGGTLKLTTWTRSSYVGSLAGNFSIKMNSYYTRTEDSTYTVDTSSVTVQVQKYYTKPIEVTGSVGGLMGYTVF